MQFLEHLISYIKSPKIHTKMAWYSKESSSFDVQKVLLNYVTLIRSSEWVKFEVLIVGIGLGRKQNKQSVPLHFNSKHNYYWIAKEGWSGGLGHIF